MNLLQIPIVDEFHLANPLEAKKRGSDFAAQKGFLGSAFGPRRGTPLPTPKGMSGDVGEQPDAADGEAGDDQTPGAELAPSI